MLEIGTLDSLAAVPAAQWDALTRGHPMLAHAFLHALEASGCVGEASGWTPCHRVAYEGDRLVGALPLYLKAHSYGEYVFDWAWAEAYQRHGLRYYPKLLGAIPFSPVGAPKLLGAAAAVRDALLRSALALEPGVSSFHLLFPNEDDLSLARAAGMLVREGVQFHWHNRGYRTFDEFLAGFAHDKRKKVKQERRKVQQAGIRFERKVGPAIHDEDWLFFNRCYRTTYREHHSSPYLNLDFFRRIGATMGDHLLLVMAYREDQPIAAALNVFGQGVLYGRYWGTTEFHSGLHFETCYYQALEFCIEQGLAVFEGGAQGEHKLARGFDPVRTHSVHWLAHPEFADAVEKFLQRESQGIGQYIDELRDHQAYRASTDAP